MIVTFLTLFAIFYYLPILFWIGLSIAVGMFASIRRDRSGGGWFFLSLIISPLLAGIYIAILKPLPEVERHHVQFEELSAREQFERLQEAVAAVQLKKGS